MNRIVKGIVLRASPYKEKDAMITILTEDGILSFGAHGVLSPTSKNASSCTLYSYSEFVLSLKGEIATLSSSKLIKTFKKIYTSLENIATVSFMGEATLKFADESNTTLFPFFLNILYALDNDFDESTLLAIYLAKVIMQSGYELNYSECVKCSSKKSIVKIDFSEGGLICSKCATSYKEEDTNYLKSFRYVFLVNLDQIEHFELEEKYTSRLINEFSNYLCNCFGIPLINSIDLYNKAKNI